MIRQYYRKTDVEFERDLRRQLAADMMLQTVAQSATVSEDEVRAQFLKEGNRAELTFVRFTPAMFAGKVPAPTAEQLQAFKAEREAEIKKEIARGREEITRTILAEARKIIPQYGIELVDVRIKRLDYIESVREKVYARMVSERKRIAAQFRSEGEGRSAEILGGMEKELRQIRSAAYRQVQELTKKINDRARGTQ
jgi:hypothetical protein